MRKSLIGFCLTLSLFCLFAQSQATCPEQPVDAGICDTLNVNVHPSDVGVTGDPYYLVRFPIRITHDLTSPADSLAGFKIPLCYTNTNTSAYCSLTSWWNTTTLNQYDPAMARSIFRDLDEEDNWFQSLYGSSFFPPSVFLSLDGTSHFWLDIVLSYENRLISGVNRGLFATMTFKLNDSTTICIDSCFWPTTNHLAFINSMGQSYVPRDNMPICEPVAVKSDCGDWSDDGTVNLGDVVDGLGYLFKGEDPPDPLCRGDANCDEVVNLTDLIYLINYLYREGSAPCFECCSGKF